MGKIRLYNVLDEYINYLRKFDRKVFSNKEEDRKKERKIIILIILKTQ